jgi:hypothetical protein
LNFGSRLHTYSNILFFATLSRFEDVYAKILANFDWKRLAALTEDGMKYTQYITNMESTWKQETKHGIELFVNKKFTRVNNKDRQLENFKSVSVKIA